MKIKRLITLLVIPFLLNGCIAAAVPLVMAVSYGATGFMVFKQVQTTTGGSVEISFEKEEISNETKISLSEISKPALWPDNEAEVYMAEKMQNSGNFTSVVTPAQVSKSIFKLELEDKIKNMTNSEMLITFNKLCEATGADAIIAFKDMGMEAKTNIWSFKQANITQQAKMLIYSYPENSIVYENIMEVKSEISGDGHNNQEIIRIAADAAAEKFISLTRS